MSLDVYNASHVAQGEPFVPAPIWVRGMELVFPATPSTQVTGAGATALRARYTGGRVKVFDHVRDFNGAEVAVKSGAAALLTVGQAQYFAFVAVQHKVSGSIGLLFVAGTVAAVANVAKPTMAEIQAALGDNPHFAILGDVRYHRSADTVIDTQVDSTRQPAYVDEANKVGVVHDTAAPTTQESVFYDTIDLPIDLAAAFAEGSGNLYIDGSLLPELPYGGYIPSWEYIGTVAGAGAGAAMTLRLGKDGTAEPTSDLALTLANTDIPARVVDALATPIQFQGGEGLDVEVEAATTAFTAGAGILRIEIWQYK